jgi:hypothetical protein
VADAAFFRVEESIDELIGLDQNGWKEDDISSLYQVVRMYQEYKKKGMLPAPATCPSFRKTV